MFLAVVLCLASASASGQTWTLDESLRSLAPQRDGKGRPSGNDRFDAEANDRPVFVVRISPQTLLERIEREVDVTTAVQHVVLGTRAAGECRTCGKLAIELVPREGCADFVLVLKGSCKSRTTGHNGPAVIHSRSTSEFVAKKRIVYDVERGFRAGPAVVRAATDLEITGIDSTWPGIRGRFVRAIASRRASETHALAEQITDRDTEEHVARDFDEHVDRQIARLNASQSLRQSVAQAADVAQADVDWSIRTTDEYIEVSWGDARMGDMHDVLRHSLCEVWVPFSLAGPETAAALEFWSTVRDTGRRLLAPGSAVAPVVEFGRQSRLPHIAVTPVERWLVLQLNPQHRAGGGVRVSGEW
jgi:hypothetical protein